jgi:hypothetical protein
MVGHEKRVTVCVPVCRIPLILTFSSGNPFATVGNTQHLSPWRAYYLIEGSILILVSRMFSVRRCLGLNA